jgi:hypothetical protein
MGVLMDHEQLRRAWTVVMEGRDYTREHFPNGSAGKFVGRLPAEEYDAALDLLLAELPRLIDGQEAPHGA